MRWRQLFCCSMHSREKAELSRTRGSGWREHPRALFAAVMLSAAACAREVGRPVRVTIPSGAPLGVAADSLARAGVIRSAQLFRLYALVRRDDRDIKPGTYMLRRNSAYGPTLDAIRGGKGLVRSVTIPEGFSLSQIISAFGTKLTLSPESLAVAVRDTALLHQLDIPTETIEGYVFPDTYIFPDQTNARAAIAVGVRRFEQVWQPEWTARLDTVGLSRHDVMTLASIVEKEARLPEERPVIAAVYMNRLRDHMLLQADPTVQYALGIHQSRVLYKDLEVESQYNTYKHPGLPPGPIASPGRASIIAALYPASVPYKYFVALPDGHHEFRTDFAGHETARRLARRAWDSVTSGVKRDGGTNSMTARRPRAR
jgi:UPF0755 protein